MNGGRRHIIVSDGDNFGATFRVVASHNYKGGSGQWYTVEFVECNNSQALESEKKAKKKRDTASRYNGLAFFGTLKMSNSPYIVYKGTFKIDDNKLIPVPIYQKLKAQRPKRIRVSDAIYILVSEFKLYETPSCAGRALGNMIKHEKISLDETRTMNMEQFEKAFYYKSANLPSSEHKISGIRLILIKIFGYDEKKQKQTIRMLDTIKLTTIHAILKTTPWKLCFYRYCGALFNGLGELSYDGMKRALKEFNIPFPEEYIMTAIRLYCLTINRARNEFKWTSFDVEWLKREHLKSKWGTEDGSYFENALIFMLKSGVVVDVTETTIAREKDYNKAQSIIDSIVIMSQRKGVSELRPGTAVPAILPGDLDEGQKEAARHILEGWPLTILTGSPGTGKSATGILWTVARFLRVLIVSFVGSMVEQHRESTSQAFTMHHVHHTAISSEIGAKWAAGFDIVTVDEGSNASLSLMSKILKAVDGRNCDDSRGLLQLVIVMDQHQQQPITPGCPAIDLKNTFPEHTFELKTQHRQGEGAYIHKSAQLLLKDRIDDVNWCVINSRRPKDFKTTLNNPENCLVRIDPASCPSIGQFINYTTPNVLEDSNNDLKSWLFFAFRNKEVDLISHRIREWLLKKGELQQDKQILIPNSKSKYSDMSNSLTSKNGLYLSQGTKIIFKRKFMGEWDYKLKERRHPTVYRGQIAIIKTVSNNGKKVTLEDGRILLMDRTKHVDPKYIKYGYCVTAYASQGMTVDCSVTYVHENPDKRWRRPPLYVAWTRPRKRTIIWGNYKDIKAIADRPPLPRSTILSVLLKKNPSYKIIRDAVNKEKRTELPDFRPISTLWVPDEFCTHGPTLEHVKKGIPFKWNYLPPTEVEIPENVVPQDDTFLFGFVNDDEEDGFMNPIQILDDDDDDINTLKKKRQEEEEEVQ